RLANVRFLLHHAHDGARRVTVAAARAGGARELAPRAIRACAGGFGLLLFSVVLRWTAGARGPGAAIPVYLPRPGNRRMDESDRVRIRAFVEELLGEHDDHAAFGDTESLIRTGRLDSLAVVKLVTFLESDFTVDFARVEFDPERFDTVAEIASV